MNYGNISFEFGSSPVCPHSLGKQRPPLLKICVFHRAFHLNSVKKCQQTNKWFVFVHYVWMVKQKQKQKTKQTQVYLNTGRHWWSPRSSSIFRVSTLPVSPPLSYSAPLIRLEPWTVKIHFVLFPSESKSGTFTPLSAFSLLNHSVTVKHVFQL